ncbi:hypothetical protein JCM11641_008056 [Rhodosporidiobolus odoratus]
MSNPVSAWASHNPFAPIAPISEAGSVRSTGSVARRAAAAAAAHAERRRRRAAFEAEEQRIAQRDAKALDAADEVSAAVKMEGGAELGQPGASAVDAEVEVVRRGLEDLDRRRTILRRYLGSRGGAGTVVEIKEEELEDELDEVEEAAVSVRVKVNPPSTWKGSYDRTVLEAVRAHWKPDQAADAALAVYRSARQGTLRVRDFGAKVETLADACFDRTLDEADRISSFVTGLNSNYRKFLKTQLATLKTLGRLPITLAEHVDLAATADGLKSFTSSLKKNGAVSSSSTSPSTPKKAASGTQGSSSTGANSEKTARWRSQAEEWQKAHPAASRGEWLRDASQAPPQPVYCYNCGRFEKHYSTACSNPRKDPSSVTIAAFRLPKLDSGGLLPASYSIPPVTGIESEDGAGDASAGKVGGV